MPALVCEVALRNPPLTWEAGGSDMAGAWAGGVEVCALTMQANDRNNSKMVRLRPQLERINKAHSLQE